MINFLPVWGEFLLCSAFLTYFAYMLAEEGIVISGKTGMSAGIMGMFFLAVATSFPEIITGATAVFHLGRIGLGYGDIIGSVIVNLMILLALDNYIGKGRLLSRVSRITSFTGLFSFIILGVVFIAAALRFSGVELPSIGRMGIESILIIGIYFTSLLCIKKMDSVKTMKMDEKLSSDPFITIWAKFIFFLLVVMGLGVWMANIGEKIIVATDLSQTFTGTLLLGFTTSLPEIIVSFSALRAGSPDMAVGNILGSNLFDVCIIPLLDGLCNNPILGMLSAGQVLATGIVLFLSAVAAIAVFIRSDSKFRINWDTSLIFVVGAGGFVLLYYIK